MKKIKEVKNHPFPEENDFFDELKDSMSKHAELSMLDHFAGLAMQGILASQIEMRSNGGCHGHGYVRTDSLAKESYDLAQAMIEERRKR